jgi:hypothetical protein
MKKRPFLPKCIPLIVFYTFLFVASYGQSDNQTAWPKTLYSGLHTDTSKYLFVSDKEEVETNYTFSSGVFNSKWVFVFGSTTVQASYCNRVYVRNSPEVHISPFVHGDRTYTTIFIRKQDSALIQIVYQ